MRGYLSPGSSRCRAALIAALAAALALGVPRLAVADDEDGCEKAPGELYATCKLIVNLEKFSQAAAAKERWEDVRDYAGAAIHAIDYLLRKVGDTPAQAPLRKEMTARRAELDARRKELDTRKANVEEALAVLKNEEEERREKVLVNLHLPSPSPDVYVNGARATGPVYVPRGPIVLGIGQDGGRYDVGTLSTMGKSLEVDVAGVQSFLRAGTEAKGTRILAFDLSVAPIFGARQRGWINGDVAAMGGFRGEVTLPDIALGQGNGFLGETLRLRPVLQYRVEELLGSSTGQPVHGFGGGLKLSATRFLDFSLALSAGIEHVKYLSESTRWSAYAPELSLGASYPVLDRRSTNGLALSVGVTGAAGISYWEKASAEVAPYAHGGVFLRFQYGIRTPPPAPPAPPASHMIHFKGGPVLLGSNDSAQDGRPEHIVLLLSFDLDVKEVTVADYRTCVDSGKCSPPGTAEGCNWNALFRGNHPINCVTRAQASTYCGFVKKRLPTESEWEHAARGPRHRQYPWGSEAPTTQPCWSGHDKHMTSTCEVGSHPDDRTPDGVLDLAGNVSEWTGPSCDERDASCRMPESVTRGGSFDNLLAKDQRSAARFVLPPATDRTVGFRCAR